MVTYLGSSITHVIPTWQSTLLFVTATIAYTTLLYLLYGQLNLSKNYVSITRRKRESKLGNNVIARKRIVGDGYLGFDWIIPNCVPSADICNVHHASFLRIGIALGVLLASTLLVVMD